MTARRLIYVLLIGTILATGCRKKEDRLPPDKMRKILTDLHLAEVYSTMVGQDSMRGAVEKNLDSLAHYYREILAHHQTSFEEFRRSMDWYTRNPEQLDSVYARMLPAFSELEAIYQRKN